MKTAIYILCVLMLVISCERNITDIKITASKNDKNYKCYIQKIGSRPDSIIIATICPWIEDPENTVFIYMPISFKLENNTGRDLRISKIWDNYSITQYRPIFIDNKYYEDISGRARISSGSNVNITLFVHLPISINLLDKEYNERLFPTYENHKRDSIVMNKINPELQKEIDILLKKKQIYISYHESKDTKENALAYYCVNKQEIRVFRSDSLAKLKESFRYDCD